MNHLTMTDIARLAGVSLTTVGRVVRGKGYVSREKREAVERVIGETGYVPNRAAQGLKSNRTNLIGHLTVLNPNMLYEQISRSLNRAASERGYQVLTYTVDRETGDRGKVLDELIAQRVAGIVITSCPGLSGEMLGKVLGKHIPLVMIERTIEAEGSDRIAVADLEGAREAVDYLFRRGHRKIGFVGKNPDQEVEARRLAGYREGLAGGGIPEDESLVVLTRSYTVEEGREAGKALLDRADRPSAVFMTSDLLVCGFLQACYERNLRVPDDISLVGYDNTLSMMLSPPVTSVSLEMGELGERAVELLMTRGENREGESREVLIRTVLIERDSVKTLF